MAARTAHDRAGNAGERASTAVFYPFMLYKVLTLASRVRDLLRFRVLLVIDGWSSGVGVSSRAHLIGGETATTLSR
jgi:hypothetical protein